MRLHRIVPAALAALVLLPLAASAQQARAGSIYRTAVVARGFLGIQTSEVVTATSGTVTSRSRTVTDVVPGSPAEKAGVVKGDTIIRINGAAATGAVMATPYEPGDTVTLRLRRNGRERDVRLVAAERPQQMYGELIPTEINDRIAVIRDRIALGTDSTFPRLRVTQIHGDSTVIVFGSDTIRAFGRAGFPMALKVDSLHASLMRLPHDSVFVQLRAGRAGAFEMLGDSSFKFFRPAEIATGTFTYGVRAVAGAELHDLNPALGASFGVQRGVLVLDAREGTPAARAGLLGGDVIVRANNSEIATISDLRRAIETTGPGGSVQLRVLRRGQNIDITLPRD
jgi:S1-C subfamily serine protease